MTSTATEVGDQPPARPSEIEIPADTAEDDTRLIWRSLDPADRERQIAAFCRWLPMSLQSLPGIDWTAMPGRVMGYLVRRVSLTAWWGIPTVLACGAASMQGSQASTQYVHVVQLFNLWRTLTKLGVTAFSDLRDRSTWQALIRQPHTPIFAYSLQAYCVYADHIDNVFSDLEEEELALWDQYRLPMPMEHHLRALHLQRVLERQRQRRRKMEVEVVLPLQHFLSNLALFRKQAAERANRQYLDACQRVTSGEVTLPYEFTITTTNPVIVDNQAESVADLKIDVQEVELPVTLWDRPTWTLAHGERTSRATRKAAAHQYAAYALERNDYYLEFRCSPARVFWFGDLLAARLLNISRGHRTEFRDADTRDPQLVADAVRLGFPTGVGTTHGGVLSPPQGAAQYLKWNTERGDLLVHWESLYRGILYATALAVVSLSSAARTCEIQQISMDRWIRRTIDEIVDGRKTGRRIPVYLQYLLPKGASHEEERQLFLISPQAASLLMEIGRGLASDPKLIPVRKISDSSKAEQLKPERYLFQWTDRLRTQSVALLDRASVLGNADINMLLRFMFHGLELWAPNNKRIRITVHLLRHVLATYARHRASVPPEVIAFLLHHRLRASQGSDDAPQAGESTDYYSREPESETLSRLVRLQEQAILNDDCLTIGPITEQDLQELDEDLQETFEQWGTIGTTALGYCKAGMCIRQEDRALCIGCPFLVVYHRMLNNARAWRTIFLEDIRRLEGQGNKVETRQRRVKLKWLDGYIASMEMQLQVLADGGRLPKHFTLAEQFGRQATEVLDHAH
jgi:hypothetical protein